MTPKVLRRAVNWVVVVAATASVVAAVATRNTWTSAERMVRGNHLVVGYRGAEIRRVSLLSEGRKLVLARGDANSMAGQGTARGAATQLAPGAEDPADLERLRESARWVFVEPYQGEAEEAAVDALLRAIEFAPYVRKVDDATLDRRAAGLDAPQQSIELDMGEVRTRLHVGAIAPTPANARYVEVGGEGTANKGVYVVSDTTAKELLVSPDTFRVRQVVPYGAASLEQVTLRQGKDEVALQAGARGDWRIAVNGKDVRLDRDAAQRLFAALSRSRADQFVADASKLEPTSATVQATFVPKAKDKAPLVVRFGGPCPTDSSASLAVVEGTPPLGACTVPLHLDTFVTQLPGLADRHLFGQHLDAVEELQVKVGERTLELARRQDGWAMRSPQAGTVERDVGDAFVTSILDARGELAGKPEVPLVEVATLTLYEAQADEQKQDPEVVTVFALEARTDAGKSGASNGDSLFVHRQADDAWLSLSPKHRVLFEPNVLLLKATQLVNLETEQVETVRVRTATWEQAFTYAGAAGCGLSAPRGYQADAALCLDIVDELRVLRAKRWVAESDRDEFGLGEPTLRVVFTTRDKPSQARAPEGADEKPIERTLTVGGRTADGGYYAQLSPDPAVFVLRSSTVDALSTLVVDRAPFLFDAQSVETLTIQTGGREVNLRRLGDELVGTGATDKVALLDALSMVRPEGAVALTHVGRANVAAESYGFDKPLLDVRVTRRVDDVVREFRWVVGRGDVYRDVGIFYAMPITSDPSAIFVLPREAVQRITGAL